MKERKSACRRCCSVVAMWLLPGIAFLQTASEVARGQEQAPKPQPAASAPAPGSFQPPAPAPCDKLLPINLPTALRLGNARPIDIALASERIRLAAAQLQRARILWLPTLYVGTDYFRHDGRLQNVEGNVFDTSKSSFLLGAGPAAVFALSDAIFEPLAQRRVLQARQADFQTATNDSVLAVAEAYFNVEEARGDLAGAEDALRIAEDVVRKTEGLKEFTTAVDLARANAESARRRQALHTARERWRTASAELVRVLRLDPAALVEPLEPPHLQVTLVSLDQPVDALIPVALSNRPELAAQQALVQATLQRLRQERLRPLVPSILLRGAATNPASPLAGGYFGGGINEQLDHFGARGDFDVQLLWEWQNLGFGNRARQNERRAEHQLSVLELFRIQDRVAAEVAQAYAQAQSAAARVDEAADELKNAVNSAQLHLEGMREPVRRGNLLIFIIRPQESVAAVSSLAQAYGDYYGAVADYNRAQFRLYRALGQPAQFLADPTGAHPAPPATCEDDRVTR